MTTASEPLNPNFEREVREGFARQPFMSTIGARLARVAPGEVDIDLDLRPDLLQQSGSLHAGVIAAIADSASGGAAFTLMPPGSDVVSVEIKLNLLAPATASPVIARARVIRPGRSLTVTAADVFAGEVHVATMLATMMRKTRTT